MCHIFMSQMVISYAIALENTCTSYHPPHIAIRQLSWHKFLFIKNLGAMIQVSTCCIMRQFLM